MDVVPFLPEHGFMLADMAKVTGESIAKFGHFCMSIEAIFFLKCQSHSRNIIEELIT